MNAKTTPEYRRGYDDGYPAGQGKEPVRDLRHESDDYKDGYQEGMRDGQRDAERDR
jgi:hypothetical protein